MIQISYDKFQSLFSKLFAFLAIVARIGAIGVVFGLVTPLDHPLETPCLFYIYIIYSSHRCMRGVWVRWSSGGHETKIALFAPILATNKPDDGRFFDRLKLNII